MTFPYGKAALTILLLAVISGVWLACHPAPRRTATVTMWTFADTHYRAYRKAIPAFEAAHPGVKVDLQLVANSSIATRLQTAFLADLDVPDLCEIEISSAGSFFRGPLKDVGFEDLTDRIHSSGLWDGMVKARFAPYTSRGRIFGLPHDVHPVMLAYRRDLFEQLGIDAAKLKTWDDFAQAGRRIVDPRKPRYMIELADTNSGNLETFLFQRDGGFFDPAGKVIFDNEAGVQTMLWYVPLVAGPHKIANSLGGGQILTQAVEEGSFLCLVAPDWRSKSFEVDIARMSGKMALMPLPAVAPGARPTSTWGGTMFGMTKKCRRKDLAWQLMMHLYLDKPELANRFRDTNILPCLRAAWDQPVFDEPRPYWSGQKLGRLYAQLAPQVPFQYTSPFIGTAKGKLGEALTACVAYYNAHGDNGFEAFVRRSLKKSADEVRRQLARNPY